MRNVGQIDVLGSAMTVYQQAGFLARIARLMIVATAVFGFCCPTFAGSGDVHRLPTSPQARLRSKLRLNLDTRWVDGTGYRPVVVEAIPTPGPAASDRQIRVTLKPIGQSQREVSTLIDIPQGSRSVKQQLLLPQDELWHNLYVDVTEGGREIEELSGQYLNFARTNYWNWTEASPGLLFIDSDVPPQATRDMQVAKFRATATDPNPTHKLPDYRNLVRTFPESNYATIWVSADGSQKVGDIDLLSQLKDVARTEILPLEEVPNRWLALTSFDLVFISRDDLEKLAKSQPERFNALTQWLRAGSVLCVYDVGEKYEHLGDLEKRLKLPPRSQRPEDDEKYRGWRVPDLKKRFAGLPQTMYSQPMYSQQMSAGNYAGVDQSSGAAVTAEAADFSAGKPAPETWPFIVRDAGLGYVVAMSGQNPFPGETQQWTWMLQTIPGEHWMWFRRHGMSLHRENSDFWNFLIPGVGVAPVLSFLLLITLFAAVIGPVNYIVLGRWRRLYLLLITVPAGAAIVTASLFLYAVVTDGLGVRARIRSFTELDARSGEAVSWSRQSYYASIAPSQGLHFPDDAAVYPLVHQPTSRNGQRWTGQKLNWDDGQRLEAGYLSSRSATQFLVVRTTATKSRLVVQPRTDGGPPRVKNDLGCNVQYLVIADSRSIGPESSTDGSGAQDGDSNSQATKPSPKTYWQIENLASGATAEAKTVSVAEVRKRLNAIYKDNAPAYPKDYDPMSHSNAAQLLFTDYYRYVNVDPGQSPPAMATGILERNLLRLARKDGAMLDPGTFLAVTDSPPEVPLGVDEMRQDRSLHVVHGRWGDK